MEERISTSGGCKRVTDQLSCRVYLRVRFKLTLDINIMGTSVVEIATFINFKTC